MSSRDISDLYSLHRYPQQSIGLLTFLLYLPFGIVFLLLRVILGIQVFIFGALLPDVPVIQKILCKLLCTTLGIIVYIENPDKKENVNAYISNYVSPFDHLVVHSVTGSVMPGNEDFNSLLSTAMGLHYFGSLTTNFNSFRKNLSTTITNGTLPIHFEPEFKQTNGKAILKFKTWPFDICSQVQPISIEVCRPIVDIKVSTFDSAYWSDTMAYLFSPCTCYKLRFLPTVEKMNLTKTQFSDKVRQDIASSLKVELSEYAASDLIEWEKRINADLARREMEETRPGTSSITIINSEVNRMARQVKEVLPMVPHHSICADLLKTRNVDQTITNILEGRVRYIPEEIPSPSCVSTAPKVVPTTSTNQSTQIRQEPLNTAASSFGKSAQERMLSFQERKQQLIETARQRYIEKHGLNIVGSS